MIIADKQAGIMVDIIYNNQKTKRGLFCLNQNIEKYPLGFSMENLHDYLMNERACNLRYNGKFVSDLNWHSIPQEVFKEFDKRICRDYELSERLVGHVGLRSRQVLEIANRNGVYLNGVSSTFGNHCYSVLYDYTFEYLWDSMMIAKAIFGGAKGEELLANYLREYCSEKETIFSLQYLRKDINRIRKNLGKELLSDRWERLDMLRNIANGRRR